MKKHISIFLAICLVITSVPVNTFGAVTRTITVTKEKTLPFSVTSQTAAASVSLSISGLSNAQVIGSYVDNGIISNTSISGSSLYVYLNNGTYSSQPKTVIKSNTLNITNELETNETSHTINKTAIGPVSSILNCTGDFLSASYSGTNINIKVDTTKGVDGFDYNQKVFDEFTVSSDASNRNRDVTVSKTLPYSILSVRTKSAKCNNYDLPAGNISYSISGNTVNTRFVNGTPKASKSESNLTHTYQWVDRHRDGHFSPVPYYPSKNYWAPNSYSFGYNPLGKYEYPNSNINSYVFKLSDWTDYMGYTMGNKKYIYIFNKDKGTPKEGDFPTAAKIDYAPYSLTFKPQDVPNEAFLNTEKAKVTFNNSGISYEPEGKLSRTEDWDEADAGENQDTFYNVLTNDYETYVMHFKFHFGPDKHGFGGYFTYPYTCTAEYEHYKPVKRYSGTVDYTYQTIENSPGYTYNGWVKVNYTEQVTITDNPPARPGAILATSTQIMHGPSTDDYTPQNQLAYKYYYNKNNTWNYLGITYNGQTNIGWNPSALGLDLANLRVGVIANDLYQDGPMGENDPATHINLTASTDKNTLAAGDSLTLDATTDSSPDCFQVSYNVPGVTSGNLSNIGKTPVETYLYHVTGSYQSYDGYYHAVGLLKYVNGTEYLIAKNKVQNLTTGVQTYTIQSMGTALHMFGTDPANPLAYYKLGPKGTIILPPARGATFFDVFSIYYRGQVGSLVTNAELWSTYDWIDNWNLGLRTYVKFFGTQLPLARIDLPVAITYEGTSAKVYQNGVFLGNITLAQNPEGTEMKYISYNYSGSGTWVYDYRTPWGKVLLSKSVWSLDQINNFLAGPWQDGKWISGGVGYVVPGLPDYSPWVPGSTKWRQTITIPATTRNGLYIMTVTALNGLQKSVDIPITVSTPINPIGTMPTKVARGSTYTVTATSSKYVNDMKLIVFGNTYTMTANGFDGSGNKKWTYNLTVPGNASFGTYNQSSGGLRYAEFKASIPSGETASDYKIFDVVVSAAVSGNNIYAQPGQVITITATTSGYCSSASVTMPTGTVTLINDNPTNYYDNTWRKSYTVPITQPKGTYSITYSAANAYTTSTAAANLYISEPIDLVGFVNGISDNSAKITGGQTNIITATTTKFPNQVKITVAGTRAINPFNSTITLNTPVSEVNGVRTWQWNLNTLQTDFDPDETVVITFVATTPTGNSETYVINAKSLAAFLSNFRLMNVQGWDYHWMYYDVDWNSSIDENGDMSYIRKLPSGEPLNNAEKNLTALNSKYVNADSVVNYSKELPQDGTIDNVHFPKRIMNGAAITCRIDGYGFNNPSDTVNINIKYKVYDESQNKVYDTKVFWQPQYLKSSIIDSYVSIDDPDPILGTYFTNIKLDSSKLIYNQNGHQVWEFSWHPPYYICTLKEGYTSPSKTAQTLLPYVVHFDIVGQKSSGYTYNYTQNETSWSSSRPAQYKMLFKPGDVIIYDQTKNIINLFKQTNKKLVNQYLEDRREKNY